MFGINLSVIAIASSVALGTIGLGYWHYTGLLDKISLRDTRIAQMESQVARQNVFIKAAEDNITLWEKSQEEMQQKIDQLELEKTEAAITVRKYNDLFAKHDFTKLVNAKPGLLQRRINAGSDDTWRLLRCASGRRSTRSKRKGCFNKIKKAKAKAKASEAKAGRSPEG